MKFGLKDTGDESEGHDLDTESQGHSVARLDSPTSQSLDASEAPSTLRELHGSHYAGIKPLIAALNLCYFSSF